MKYLEKLRNSGLRPTKQRLQICEVLFNTNKTFHFTINDLSEKIKKQTSKKISLATLYNTVHAFEKKGYLKQIPINSSQTYFWKENIVKILNKNPKLSRHISHQWYFYTFPQVNPLNLHDFIINNQR